MDRQASDIGMCCGLRRDQHLDQNPDLDPNQISPFEHDFQEATDES